MLRLQVGGDPATRQSRSKPGRHRSTTEAIEGVWRTYRFLGVAALGATQGSPLIRRVLSSGFVLQEQWPTPDCSEGPNREPVQGR